MSEKLAMKSESVTFSFGATEIGGLKSIGEIGGTADEIDVTTLDATNGYKSFLQGFKDGGEVALSGFLYAKESRADIVTAFDNGTVSACTITFPDGSKLAFQGWIKGYKMGPAEVGQAITFNATVRVSGAITYTAATVS